jgi:hypothetical protein
MITLLWKLSPAIAALALAVAAVVLTQPASLSA